MLLRTPPSTKYVGVGLARFPDVSFCIVELSNNRTSLGPYLRAFINDLSGM